VIVGLLGLVLGLLGLLVGLVGPLLRALSTLVGLLGLILRLLHLVLDLLHLTLCQLSTLVGLLRFALRLLGLTLCLLQLVLGLLGLALRLLGLVLGLPRLALRLLGGTPGLLRPLPCAVGILLRDASLVFHSLQVPLQLADCQASENALVLVALVLHAFLIPLGRRLLSSGRGCHVNSLVDRLAHHWCIYCGRTAASMPDPRHLAQAESSPLCQLHQ
jgi:hypothetical protein